MVRKFKKRQKWKFAQQPNTTDALYPILWPGHWVPPGHPSAGCAVCWSEDKPFLDRYGPAASDRSLFPPAGLLLRAVSRAAFSHGTSPTVAGASHTYPRVQRTESQSWTSSCTCESQACRLADACWLGWRSPLSLSVMGRTSGGPSACHPVQILLEIAEGGQRISNWNYWASMLVR